MHRTREGLRNKIKSFSKFYCKIVLFRVVSVKKICSPFLCLESHNRFILTLATVEYLESLVNFKNSFSLNIYHH